MRGITAPILCLIALLGGLAACVEAPTTSLSRGGNLSTVQGPPVIVAVDQATGSATFRADSTVPQVIKAADAGAVRASLTLQPGALSVDTSFAIAEGAGLVATGAAETLALGEAPTNAGRAIVVAASTQVPPNTPLTISLGLGASALQLTAGGVVHVLFLASTPSGTQAGMVPPAVVVIDGDTVTFTWLAPFAFDKILFEPVFLAHVATVIPAPVVIERPILTAVQAAVPAGPFRLLAPTGAAANAAPKAAWEAASGARSYEVVVARDAACQDVVQRHETHALEVQLTTLADGTYHMCGFALNELGVKTTATGQGSSFTVAMAGPDAPGVPEPASLATSGQPLFTWTRSAAKAVAIAHYRIEVTVDDGTVVHKAEVPAVPPACDATRCQALVPTPAAGRTHRASVTAVDTLGRASTTVASTTGVLVDVTPPVFQVPPTRATALTGAASATWTWSVSDDASGLVAQTLEIGTTAGGAEFTTVALGPTVRTFTATGLATGVTYFARVLARDTAGNLTAASSGTAGVLVDLTPPSAPGAIADGGAMTSVSSVTWSWGASVDAGGSGVARYLVDVGTTPGGSQLAQGLDLGKALSYTRSSLAGSTTYYLRVRAVDLAGNVGAAADSDGILVDLSSPTAPSAPTAASGNFSTSTSVTWNWGASTDNTGIAHYLVSLGTTAFGNDVVADQNVGNVLTFSRPALVTGTSYFLTVKAVDTTGNTGAVSAAPAVLVDLNPPGTPGTPTTGAAASNAASLVWTWSAPSDAGGSGVYDYLIDVGTSSGGNEITSAAVAPGTTYTHPGASSGVTYYLTVKARDAAGNVGTAAASAGTLSDQSTPGGVGTVTDNGAYDTLTTTNWGWSAASDGLSGISHYLVDVGTTSGGSDVQAGINVGNVLTYSRGGLASGTTYYLRVRAVDNAGNLGPTSDSDGVMIDSSDPTPPGTPVDGGAATNGSLNFSWSAGGDGTSGVANYRVDLGTTPGDDDIVANFLTSGATTYGHGPGVNGTTYYITVRTMDAAGRVSTPVTSNGIVYDTTPPTVDAGLDGNHRVSFSQTGSASDASGVVVAWTKQSGPAGTVNFATPSAPTTNISSASVEGTYVIRLTATDGAGNSAYDEATIVWDQTAPIVNAGADAAARLPLSRTATGTDAIGVASILWEHYSGPGTIAFAPSNALATIMTPNMDGAHVVRLTVTDTSGNVTTDDMNLLWDTTPPVVGVGADIPASNTPVSRTGTATDTNGVASQTWTKEAGSGTVNFSASTSLATNISASADGTYTIRMTALDGVGNSSYDELQFIWDTTGPTTPSSIADGGAHSITSSFTVTWGASSDATSSVSHYMVMVGTSVGASNIVSPTNIGNVTSYTTPALSSGSTYYVRVAAVDAAGNYSAYADTDGRLVDTAAPTAPTPVVEPGAYTNSTSVTWNWSTSTDSGGSGLEGYWVKIGTTPGGGEIQSGTMVGPGTTSYTQPGLSAGQRYFASVKAKDYAGNYSQYVLSLGIMVIGSGTIYTVNSVADDITPNGQLTLREAIVASMTDAVTGDAPAGTAGRDYIQFAPALASQVITLGSPLAINQPIDVHGLGVGQTTISGGGGTRLFSIAAGGNLHLFHMRLFDGKSDRGGAVENLGTFTADVVLFEGNKAYGTQYADVDFLPQGGDPGMGGAVYNFGVATLRGSEFVSNEAKGGNGAGDLSAGFTGAGGGGGGFGGAIFSEGGGITVARSTLTGNSATGGVAGHGVGGAGGGAGLGGAIFVRGGTSAISNATIHSNNAIGGNGTTGTGGGGSGNGPDGGFGKGGGGGGNSGGIRGGHGGFGAGGGGGGGAGAVGGNAGFAGGRGTGPGGPGASALLGGTAGAGGGGAAGAAIFYMSTAGSATITNVTMTNNTATPANGGATTQGGGIYAESVTVDILNSILAYNSSGAPAEFAGSLNSLGYNMLYDPTGTTIGGDAASNTNWTDPELGALGWNGGPTRTRVIAPTSPAKDTGTATGAPTDDQRGVPRPQGGVHDRGAVEIY